MNALAVMDYPTLLSKTQPAVVHGESENEHYTEVLEGLAAKEHPTDAERRLIELLTLLIEDFESKYYEIEAVTPIQAIQELMDAHDLKQKDLAELGIFETPSVVSEVLNGKRALTTEHIKRLSKHFNVSTEVFFDIR